MIEQIVYFVLGFVIAGLLGLLCLPVASRRAQRLTLAQLEKRLPLNLEEIEADRDLLRAQFAVQNRQLEVKAEEARSHRVADAAELGRRAVALARATEQWTQTTKALNERTAELAQARAFGEATAAALAAEQQKLATSASDLAALRQEHAALTEEQLKLQALAQEQQVRLIALEENFAAQQKRLDEAKAGRDAERLRADQHAAEERRLAEHLTEAEKTNAAFEARRVRLLAKIAAERARGDEFETQSLGLRRALAAAAHAAPEAGSTAMINGAATLMSRQNLEMIELREAIAKIGHQVAHLELHADQV